MGARNDKVILESEYYLGEDRINENKVEVATWIHLTQSNVYSVYLRIIMKYIIVFDIFIGGSV